MEAAGHHHDHPASEPGAWLRPLAIATAVVAGAVILAPYALPALGVGNAALAEEAMSAMHGTGLGNGLAGEVNGVLNSVPLVGPRLALGGLFTAAASGVVGIGGVMLGHYIQENEDGTRRIRWGKVISTAALLTSALIALPTVLTGLSVGIVYLCAVLSGTALASSAVGLMAKTLGSVGSINVSSTGLAGAVAALPHLLTCCAAAVPPAISFGMWSKSGHGGHSLHGGAPERNLARGRAQHPGSADSGLPPDDPNRFVTREQQEMVDRYNDAPARRKSILRKWFRENGFDPDYHDDGTMHLFYHSASLSR